MDQLESLTSDLNALIESSPPKNKSKTVRDYIQNSDINDHLNHSMDKFIRTKTINSDEEFQIHKIANDILSSNKLTENWRKKNGKNERSLFQNYHVSISEQTDLKAEDSLIINKDINKIQDNYRNFQMGSQMKEEKLTDHLLKSKPSISKDQHNLSKEKVSANVYTFQNFQRQTLKIQEKSKSPNKSGLNTRKALQTQKIGSTKSIDTDWSRSDKAVNTKNTLNLVKRCSDGPVKPKFKLISERILRFQDETDEPFVKGDSFAKIEQYFDQKYELKDPKKTVQSMSKQSGESSLKRSSANDPFIQFKQGKLDKLVKILQ